MVPADPARALGAATYDDILALPRHVVGEIIAGTLHVSPRPAPPPPGAAGGGGVFLRG